MARRALDVWCAGALAGRLEDADDDLAFEYAAQWRESRSPPLSQSLPLDGSFGPSAVAAYFGGLLLEGTPRDVLTRRLGVSVDNDFSLLAALGGDTAGAISLVAPDAGPPSGAGEVGWLDEAELAAEIEQLPSRPMRADEDGEYRLSLAGAQDKLPVVVAPDGTVGLTTGRTPSTHIMKTPIAGLEHTVANEALCLDVGRRLEISAARATPRRVGSRECLLVGRYDRDIASDGAVERLHQEDVCQALGVPSRRKYQAEGGPSLPDVFALVRRAMTVPARDTIALLDQVTLSFLVGNHDAHAKNFSLLYRPGATELAPAYDVLSTVVYRGARRLSRKMAMSIGTEYRPEYVRARHLAAMLSDTGLGAPAARRRITSLAAAAPAHALEAREALAADGWDAPLLGRIVELVERRAGWLIDMT